jgi:hypothetical protein
MDASNTQLGLRITVPLLFIHVNLILLKCNIQHTTTECELSAIVETLKEFHNILLGQQIQIHTDH